MSEVAPKDLNPRLSIGDHVALPGRVVMLTETHVVIETDPVDLPGSPGYRQRVTVFLSQARKVKQP